MALNANRRRMPAFWTQYDTVIEGCVKEVVKQLARELSHTDRTELEKAPRDVMMQRKSKAAAKREFGKNKVMSRLLEVVYLPTKKKLAAALGENELRENARSIMKRLQDRGERVTYAGLAQRQRSSFMMQSSRRAMPNARPSCSIKTHGQLAIENVELKQRIAFLENEVAMLRAQRVTPVQLIGTGNQLEIRLQQKQTELEEKSRQMAEMQEQNRSMDVRLQTDTLRQKKSQQIVANDELARELALRTLLAVSEADVRLDSTPTLKGPVDAVNVINVTVFRKKPMSPRKTSDTPRYTSTHLANINSLISGQMMETVWQLEAGCSFKRGGMHSEGKHLDPTMFATRVVICAIGAALALAAPSVRLYDNGSEAKQAATSVPMKVMNCGSHDECYRVDVNIGTPPQKYRLTLDNTMFVDIHVFSSKMPPPNSTCKSTDISRKYFDPSASSTYVGNGEAQAFFGAPTPYYPYEDPKCTKDRFGYGADGFNDTVKVNPFDFKYAFNIFSIGSVSLPSVPANMITVIGAPLNPEWDADGFFGIQPPPLAIEDFMDTLNVFLAAFERPSVVFYYARVDHFDQNSDNGGVMTLGGVDTSNCDSKWTTVPSSRAFQGRVMIENFSIKGKSFRSWKYAESDVTTAYITAPQAAIDAVVKATGAEYDFRTDTFQVDCDKRVSFPDMVFNLPGMEYRLPAVDYARRRSVSSQRCTLMLVPDGYWKLGTSFFRPYCTQLDFKAKTFSLAKALQ